MAMRQLGCKIPGFSRIATAGSGARQLHPVTSPFLYGFGASFPSAGAVFSTHRFFCTELSSPPRRRTQGFLNFMRDFTCAIIREGIILAAGTTFLIVSCNAFGFDIRRKVHKMLVVKSEKKD